MHQSIGTRRIAFLRYAAVFLSISLSLASQASAANGRLFGISSDSGDNSVLVEIDPATGAASAVGPIGFDAFVGLAANPTTGQLLGLQINSNIVDINPETGAGVVIATLTSPPFAGVGINALAFDSARGSLLAADVGELFEADPATGETTLIGPIVIDGNSIVNASGLAFHPSSNTLFGLEGDFLAIDPTTGIGTSIGSPGGGFLSSLTFDPISNQLFSIDVTNDALVTIDTTSGSASPIGPLGIDGVFNLAFIPVPEPSSAMLAIASLCLVTAGSRTRNREV